MFHIHTLLHLAIEFRQDLERIFFFFFAKVSRANI